MQRFFLYYGLILSVCLSGNKAFSAEYDIKMLDYGEGGSMVFEPAFLTINAGDTVRFIPQHSGHSVRSYLVPEGVKPWQSTLNQPYEITFSQDGIYIYYCPPHLMMGMVGLIQVGNTNHEPDLQQKAQRLSAKMYLKPERLNDLLKQVTVSKPVSAP